MNLFTRKPKSITALIPETQRAIVEIEIQKDAKAKAVDEAREANRTLKNLLQENHFTIKIFAAAGGSMKESSHGN